VGGEKVDEFGDAYVKLIIDLLELVSWRATFIGDRL